MHQEASGAYTGEISAGMLKGIYVDTVILGHSERREYFGEGDQLLASKVDAALANDLEVIFCFGEVLEDRKSENHFKVVESQIKNALFHLDSDAWSKIILAYEPVWSIGSGLIPNNEDLLKTVSFIKSKFTKKGPKIFQTEPAHDAKVNRPLEWSSVCISKRGVWKFHLFFQNR